MIPLILLMLLIIWVGWPTHHHSYDREETDWGKYIRIKCTCKKCPDKFSFIEKKWLIE